MPMLILSAVFFLGIHLGVAGTRLRDAFVSRLGEKLYMIAFSAASLIGIVWIVKAYQGAPYLETWGPLEWWKPVAILLMLPAFVLAVVGVTTPNPTAVGQEAKVDLAPQGIVRVTRHPFLIGVGLWALVHLVGNGDVASLIFFATFVIVCALGTVSIDAKRRRKLGPAVWDPFAAQTSIIPFAALGRAASPVAWRDLMSWRIGASLVAYALMLGGHTHLVGVSPFPV